MKYTLKIQEQLLKTSIDYRNDLNAEQFEVVSRAEGPCLVLAGAGSGKTRTLVYRVAYLLEKNISPQEILLMTFTNKAAFEMISRVESLVKVKPKGLWAGTFHSLANRVLRLYAEKLGYSKDFTILDDDDSKNLLKSCVAELSLDVKNDKYFPKVNVIQSIISFSRNSCTNLSDVCINRNNYFQRDVISAIESIAILYEQKKKASNVMDFDDLLVNWYKLLRDCPDVHNKLSQQFRYILVDEYQDTNIIQGFIIDYLAQVHKNILVVGDDSQSIYSFRAATIANILEFPKRYDGCLTFHLLTNYRSTPEILYLANQSIANNVRQFKKELKSKKEKKDKPILVPTRDAYQQADFVSQRILEFQREGTDLRNMVVLFRSSFQMIELELELNKRNIPYIVRGGIRFFEQAHIKDMVSYLKVLSNPKDEISWIRIFNQWDGIGLVTAKKIIARIFELSSIEDFILNPMFSHISSRAKNSVVSVSRIFQNILESKNKNFISSAIQIILKTRMEEYIKQNYENYRDRLEDLEQLANFASNYETLDQFLADVVLSEGFRGERRGEKLSNDEEYLILSTIHQAKGLEWDTVFIIGLSEGHFPHHKVYSEPAQLEEERRLFYVACTRAKDNLYLLYPVFVSSYMTGDSICRPSTFLTEIDEDCYNKWDLEEKLDIVSDETTEYNEDGERVIRY